MEQLEQLEQYEPGKILEIIPWDRIYRDPFEKKYKFLPDGILLTPEKFKECKYALFKAEMKRYRNRIIPNDVTGERFLGDPNGIEIHINIFRDHCFLEERTQITKSFFREKFIFDRDVDMKYQSMKYVKSKKIWVKETEERKFLMSHRLITSMEAISTVNEYLNDLLLTCLSNKTGIDKKQLKNLGQEKIEVLSKNMSFILIINGIKYYSFPNEDYYLTNAEKMFLSEKKLFISKNDNRDLEATDETLITSEAKNDVDEIPEKQKQIQIDVAFETKNKLYEFYGFKDFSEIPKDYKIKEWNCRKNGKKIRQYCLTK
jgi:hypothetical protein